MSDMTMNALDFLVQLAAGALSFWYAAKFLQADFESRRWAALRWAALYAIVQFGVSTLTEGWKPYERFFAIVPQVALLFLLSGAFFEKDKYRQMFVAVSFASGWDILRFTVSPLAHAAFGAWGPAWAWAVNEAVARGVSAETVLSVMQVANDAALLVIVAGCRVLQLGLLALCLRGIVGFFPPKDYALRLHDSLFLLFPCAVALVIDLTVRMMALSADNSALMLVYDRVPETLLLLPMTSLLLLGMIVSSVMLFRGLVQAKDEEQKRLLLEQSVAGVHREVEELQGVYADLKGLRHDLRNHIANLAAYVQRIAPQNNTELSAYLGQMTDAVARLDFADDTGNPITDVIVHQARRDAEKKGVAFAADFHWPKDGRFDIYDVSVILSNALTNAVEAATREISVRSYEKGRLFFIEAANDFTGTLHWDETGDLPVTSKPDAAMHGMGLANIRRCAQKYKGEMDIQVTEEDGQKRFLLTVMLYEKV
ncbi:MAG: GHKL domain-containing protein [Schwartzia sp.]|nr:GHKL domain-containing protein [Schwartzia sp. (in: firmicutes)]